METHERPVATSPLVDGRFLLLETVGTGGMGAVYRAFDRAEQRFVALKTLGASIPAGPEHPLSAEFASWAGLRHPNVIRARELGRARRGPLRAGAPYLVLEYFDGRPAHEAVRPGRAHSDELEEFGRQVLRGLGCVHDAGVVHRDLKPGNVLVARSCSRDPRVKLTDFGLAVPIGRRGAPGRLSGSLRYAAPETMLGAPVDGRADLYGLGILLFFLSTGSLAPQGNEPSAVIRWHLGGSTPDPRRLRGDLSPRLARFIRRLCERRPERRPRDAWEALRLLGGTAAPRRASRGPRLARSQIARLRLALDAARLGGRRMLEVAAGAREPLLVEARVWAGARGLPVVELGRSSGTNGPARLALRLLLDCGITAGHRLRRHLGSGAWPLGLEGDCVVWDRRRGDAGTDSLTRVGRGLAAIVLESSRRRTLVLWVRADAPRDRGTAEALRVLREAVRAGAGPKPGHGGLLVVVEARDQNQKRFETISAPPR